MSKWKHGSNIILRILEQQIMQASSSDSNKYWLTVFSNAGFFIVWRLLYYFLYI